MTRCYDCDALTEDGLGTCHRCDLNNIDESRYDSRPEDYDVVRYQADLDPLLED